MFEPLTLKGEYYNEELFSRLRENGYKQIDSNSWLSPDKTTYIFSLVGENYYGTNIEPILYISRITMYDMENNLITEDYSQSLPKINKAIKEKEQQEKRDKEKKCLKAIENLINNNLPGMFLFDLEFQGFNQLKKVVNEYKKKNSKLFFIFENILKTYNVTYEELLDLDSYKDALPYREFSNKAGDKFQEIGEWNEVEQKFQIKKWTLDLVIAAINLKKRQL